MHHRHHHFGWYMARRDYGHKWAVERNRPASTGTTWDPPKMGTPEQRQPVPPRPQPPRPPASFFETLGDVFFALVFLLIIAALVIGAASSSITN